MFLTSLLALPDSIYSISGFQLLIVGGLFLCAAALLLAIRREHRIVIKSSVVTDELAIQAGRIADALERIATPSIDRVRPSDPRSPEKAEPERSDREATHIAYSMFGR
jgi:hypothetical protein